MASGWRRQRQSGENNNRVLTEGVPASAANEHVAPENSLQIKSLETIEMLQKKNQPALVPTVKNSERLDADVTQEMWKSSVQWLPLRPCFQDKLMHAFSSAEVQLDLIRLKLHTKISSTFTFSRCCQSRSPDSTLDVRRRQTAESFAQTSTDTVRIKAVDAPIGSASGRGVDMSHVIVSKRRPAGCR